MCWKFPRKKTHFLQLETINWIPDTVSLILVPNDNLRCALLLTEAKFYWVKSPYSTRLARRKLAIQLVGPAG